MKPNFIVVIEKSVEMNMCNTIEELAGMYWTEQQASTKTGIYDEFIAFCKDNSLNLDMTLEEALKKLGK